MVTGGSEGIGYALCYTLLQHNIAKLYLLSVSETIAENARRAWAQDLGPGIAAKTVWIQCDLGNWNRVQAAAQQITRSTDRVDILVNNAGRGVMTYQLTEYGVDRHMAVKYMGHVILTSHLLPLMKRTAAQGFTVRIVNLASNLHERVPKDIKFETLADLNQDLGPNSQYGRSKLAGILYTRYFDRHVTRNGFPNILMNAVHPGIVSTKQSKSDIHEPLDLHSLLSFAAKS